MHNCLHEIYWLTIHGIMLFGQYVARVLEGLTAASSNPWRPIPFLSNVGRRRSRPARVGRVHDCDPIAARILRARILVYDSQASVTDHRGRSGTDHAKCATIRTVSDSDRAAAGAEKRGFEWSKLCPGSKHGRAATEKLGRHLRHGSYVGSDSGRSAFVPAPRSIMAGIPRCMSRPAG